MLYSHLNSRGFADVMAHGRHNVQIEIKRCFENIIQLVDADLNWFISENIADRYYIP